jgi:cytochrome c oxidase subunit II
MAGRPSALDPQGPAAADIARLWWIIFGMGTAVFIAVMALLLFVLWRRGRAVATAAEMDVDLREANGAPWILWGGIIIPFIILIIFLYFNLRSLSFVRAAPAPPTVTVEVVGRMWWWEVRYPDEGIVTANEIRLPAGQPVQIHGTSLDVIHSFWVPQLHGKQDLTPGRIDTFWLQADEPGIYRGLCAEFCGIQHARMQLVVVSEPADRFAAWLERERQPAPQPADKLTRRGQQIFLGSSCVYCHTVRGTNATGDLGPDLTHLASRLTLGAGILENNPGNLAGWIVDPQHIKPGNLMPPTNLESADLQALLAYLSTLE